MIQFSLTILHLPDIISDTCYCAEFRQDDWNERFFNVLFLLQAEVGNCRSVFIFHFSQPSEAVFIKSTCTQSAWIFDQVSHKTGLKLVSLHMTEKQLQQMKMDIPVDTQKAVYQNSNFAPANYNVILYPPSKQMPVISLRRIQTNAIAFKVDKVKSIPQRLPMPHHCWLFRLTARN